MDIKSIRNNLEVAGEAVQLEIAVSTCLECLSCHKSLFQCLNGLTHCHKTVGECMGEMLGSVVQEIKTRDDDRSG